ncbi:hypothetical protein [Fibrobacter sp.]|uniref:hypothetical protein n=1 Tax=Fibrobacter sp. TaxID=35828 RepID=UPI00388D0A08
MKKILFSLMILAIYASANTCTEAVFEISKPSLYIPKDKPHIDSVFSSQTLKVSDTLEYAQEIFKKRIYNNGYLEKEIDGYVGDINYEYAETYYYIYSKDESVLSGNGIEILFSDSTSGDTSIWHLKFSYNGSFEQEDYYKVTNSYIANLSYSLDHKPLEYLTEFFFRNDTLVEKNTDNNSHGYEQKTEFTYFVEDPKDDKKCYKYENDSLIDTLVYHPKENGYSIVLSHEKAFREIFMIYPTGTTAIHQRRAPVKISPKARYFDLLGRYKFTK